MEREIILAKFESLEKCVRRIEAQNVSDARELEENLDKQEVIILNLQRAVQICVDIGNHVLLDFPSATPSTMSETFRKMRENNLIADKTCENLSKAVGFRNIAIHQYEDVDCKIIFSIVKKHLCNFREFAKDVQKILG
ncbi:MAG: DUF86 domain-containing protein [Treponemataceae bacterium]|nr:DUF86 domain-containing protein [Treponemataceae bacterium]